MTDSLSLNETVFHGSWTDFTRKAWVQPPTIGLATQILIFLDAELYIERVEAPMVLRRLQDRQQIPPTLAIYLSNNGATARHMDYTCSTDFAAFVAKDVVGQVKERYGEFAPKQAGITIVGLSLSGLEAAFLARQYPDQFRAAICQSPSFWWDNERFRQQIPPCPVPSPIYWISVGEQETTKGVSHPPSGMRQESTQRDACAHTIRDFETQGYTIHSRVFPGGHDPLCWRDDLAIALTQTG